MWGSWWNEELGWGFGCCHQTEKGSVCLGERGKKLALNREFKLKKAKQDQISSFAKEATGEEIPLAEIEPVIEKAKKPVVEEVKQEKVEQKVAAPQVKAPEKGDEVFSHPQSKVPAAAAAAEKAKEEEKKPEAKKLQVKNLGKKNFSLTQIFITS